MVTVAEQVWRERHSRAWAIEVARQLTGITLTADDFQPAVNLGDAGASSATRDAAGQS